MKIINILADGSVKDDLTGYRVNPNTAGDFYNVLGKICKKNAELKNTRQGSLASDLSQQWSTTSDLPDHEAQLVVPLKMIS